MHIRGFDIISPSLEAAPFSEAEALGSIVWLWMHSENHRDIPLHGLSALLLPAIKQGKFLLASQNGQPVFYISWANFSPDAEQRYLKNPAITLPQDDWNSGDRTWVLDWVAPFGHTRAITAMLRQQLFPGQCARSLYHRGEEKGLRIMELHGIAVLPEEARYWFETHPIQNT